PCPTARSAVPIAAVVFPFPGPVFTMMSPRRTSCIGRILDCNRWPGLARYRRTAITARPNRVDLQGLINSTQLRASQRTFIFCLHRGERYETSSQLGLECAGRLGR